MDICIYIYIYIFTFDILVLYIYIHTLVSDGGGSGCWWVIVFSIKENLKLIGCDSKHVFVFELFFGDETEIKR